ncbi:hypothetical protein [Leptothrix discophora]|uniref:Oxidoreductase molybdopterin-binding domain-containing protein n=1 Tax=Leptothrix discophora TaxID=89 RepID=A0ABT9FZN6_LEPDI|nr:hypothetical protein [Leptothrix discophora]MDP4299694.1 hypothetical protein [Leptothrix discophora]
MAKSMLEKFGLGALPRRRVIAALGLVALAGIGPLAQAQGLEPAKGRVLLTVTGAIARGNVAEGVRRHEFDAEALDALPVHVVRTGTPWHKGVIAFSGPLLADVLAQVAASGTTLQMTALNDYQIRMPIAEVLPFQPILARRADGAVLSVRDKGPLFMIFPYDEQPQTRNDLFFSRSIWQLKAIEVR